jgi:thioredoxin 1
MTASFVRLVAALSVCISVTAFTTNGLRSRPYPLALNAGITTYLDDSNYHSFMTKNSKTVLVDACAKWCGPCKLIEPFLVNAALKYEQDLDVVKLDVEAKNNGGVKVEFLLSGVMPEALPSLILFRDGKHLATHTGALTQEQLNDFIEAHLKKAAKKEKRELVGARGRSKGFVSFASVRDDYML